MTEPRQQDSTRRPLRGPTYDAQAARERADRSLRGLAALLDARPELRGVHAPADWAYHAVRWSA